MKIKKNRGGFVKSVYLYVFGIVAILVIISGLVLYFGVNKPAEIPQAQGKAVFVESGDTVTVDYALAVDGNLMESTFENDKNFVFVSGSGQTIKGFDNAVLGMKLEEERIFSVQPEDGYGDANSFPLKYEDDLNFILESISAQMGKEATPEQIQGGTFFMTDKFCKFTSFDLNLNKQYVNCQHRFAGKVLVFKVKVLNIEKLKVEDVNK